MDVTGISFYGCQKNVIKQADNKIFIHRRNLFFHFSALGLHDDFLDCTFAGNRRLYIFSKYLAGGLQFILIPRVNKSHGDSQAIGSNG